MFKFKNETNAKLTSLFFAVLYMNNQPYLESYSGRYAGEIISTMVIIQI